MAPSLPTVVRLDVSAAAEAPKGLCAAIGSFDGVHLGHQQVIDTAVSVTRKRGVGAAVICFDPHPQQYFFPEATPFRLMTLDQQVRAFATLGVSHVFVLEFNAALAAMDADTFAAEVLHGQLGLSHVSAGFDFSFGRRGMGKATDLVRFGEAFGFSTHIVDCQVDQLGNKLSSSAVREALTEGDTRRAQAILGHPQAFEGEVIHGDKIGRTLGFPTLNVGLGGYQRPRQGVYATRTRLTDGRVFGSVTNYGFRPTIDGSSERFETYVFDFEQEIYGETVEIELLHFLRDDLKFDGLEALKVQIAKDGDDARAWLSRHSAV